MTQYSIIIPFYARTTKTLLQLKECLIHLQKCDGIENAEIIVVDDASCLMPSHIENIIGQFNIRYIRLLQNRGPGNARNEGAKHSLGQILLFIDHDCLPHPQWLKILSNPILEKKCQATTATYTGSAKQTWLTNYQYYDFEYRTPPKECHVDFLHGCSCAIDKTTFFECAGFPEERCYEDQLFGKKLIQKGYKILYIPQGGVTHYFRTNLKAYLHQQFYFGKSIAMHSLSTAPLGRKLWKKLLFPLIKNKERFLFQKSFVKTLLMMVLIFTVFLSLILVFLFPFYQLIYIKIIFILIGLIFLLQLNFLIFILKKKKSFWTVISYFPLIILLHSVYLYASMLAILTVYFFGKLNEKNVS